MDDIAISVRNVHKSFKLPHERHTGLKQAVINFRHNRSYQMQKVLKGISFDIKKGEFFGIVGKNGSGKSTLLKILAQTYTPNEGGVIINGSLTPFIELGVGFNPELTGRENVYLNGALLGFDRKQMSAMYKDIVDFAELWDFMDQKLKNYSSGMQVRLAFSIAIRAESDILLIDEVLAVGDAAFQQKCFNYFEKLKSEKRTIVFVTHEMSAVNRFCTRALMLEDGEIKKIGKPTDIADLYTEKNINTIITEEGDESDYKVSGKIVSNLPNKVVFAAEYESNNQDEMYVGIAIIRDGISVAEIITAPELPLVGKGTVKYELSTTGLNPGTYQIGVGLFRLANREVLASGKEKPIFILKGDDKRRGAAIRLEDSWQYE